MSSPTELQGSARAVGLPATGGSANAQALGTQDAAVFASIQLSPDGGSGMIQSDNDKGMTIIDGWNQPIADLNTDNYGINLFTDVFVNGVVVFDEGGVLYYSNSNPLTDNDGGLYYGNGYGLADSGGSLYYSNSNYLANSYGKLFYGNGSLLADGTGSLYYNNGSPLTDNNGTLYYNNGNALADNNGTLYYGNGNALADGDGNLYNGGGGSLADRNGNLTAPSLTVSGTDGASSFLGAFITADLPSASGNPHAYLICTNGGTGSTPVPQWSDGTSWRKFTIV